MPSIRDLPELSLSYLLWAALYEARSPLTVGPRGSHNVAVVFTALLIAILILTGAATVIGGGLVLAAGRKRELGEGRATKALPGATEERSFTAIRVGDIVVRGDIDYLVEGILHFDEAGQRWAGARLSDGENDRWLYVGMERMGSASRRFLEADDSIEVSGFPPETLIVAAVHYTLDKRGTASAKRSGDIGSIPGTEALGPESIFRCRWWRYEGAGGATMVIEEWSGDFRILVGKQLGDDDLEMMPGS